MYAPKHYGFTDGVKDSRPSFGKESRPPQAKAGRNWLIPRQPEEKSKVDLWDDPEEEIENTSGAGSYVMVFTNPPGGSIDATGIFQKSVGALIPAGAGFVLTANGSGGAAFAAVPGGLATVAAGQGISVNTVGSTATVTATGAFGSEPVTTTGLGTFGSISSDAGTVTTNGSGALAAVSLTYTQGLRGNVTALTSTTVLTAPMTAYYVCNSGITVTLPLRSTLPIGIQVMFGYNATTGAAAVTINSNASDTIITNDTGTYSMATGTGVIFVNTSTGWIYK